MFRLFILPLLSLLFAFSAQANVVTTERTESTLLADVNSIRPGTGFWTMLQVKLQPQWHTYWINPGDSGVPETFTWTLPEGFKAGDAQYLAPEREKIPPLVDYGYSGVAYFPVHITPPALMSDHSTSILALKLRMLVCKDVCVPETANLSLALPTGKATDQVDPSPDAALIAKKVSEIPEAIPNPFHFYEDGGKVHFDMKIKEGPAVREAVFFPAEDGVIANAPDQVVSITPGLISFTLQRGEGTMPKKTWGLVSLVTRSGEHKDFVVHLEQNVSAGGTITSAAPSTKAPEQTSLTVISALLFALLGGLTLNLMPCVFPVLSLKALAVAKKANVEAAKVRLQGIAYTLGVLVSFAALALALVGVQKASGQVLGWGYQMQSPLFVLVLALLMFAVGLNLSGHFEVPVLFGSVNTGNDSLHSSFLTGVFAVMVATPCTAPFMASAVGFALTQPLAVVLEIFLSLGLGLALPFLALTFCPPLIRLLPKPGAWMQTFREFIAFPMYLSAVWLIWVLAREAGADAAAIALLALVCIGFVLWLWKQQLPTIACLVLALGLACCVYAIRMVPVAGHTLHSHSEPFSTAKLAALRAQGKGVFVDATADWCITCKVNETVALSSQHIIETLASKNITYMVADWTNGDADITVFLQSFGRAGVPLYVYYPPKGEPVALPQILTESTVLKAIQ